MHKRARQILELYSVRGAMLFFRKLVSVGTMNKINYMYLKKSYVFYVPVCVSELCANRQYIQKKFTLNTKHNQL